MRTTAECAEIRLGPEPEPLFQDSPEAVGMVHGIRGRLSQTIESAKATSIHVREATRRGARATDYYIRGHPYQSIAGALMIGVLAGAIASRKW